MNTIITPTFVLFSGMALFAATGAAVTCTYVGDDVTSCRLEVVQDVSLERDSTNYNYLDYLMIAEHPGFLLKRSLIQFENLTEADGCETLVDATMYIHFHYAHKASYANVNDVPYVKHEAHVHMVLKSWDEAEATSLYRKWQQQWKTEHLALDGTDADVTVISSNTMHIMQPSRFMAFEVKTAAQQWFFDSNPVENNGLLIKVEDESLLGRDLRFYSNAYSDSSKHAFINVICTSGSAPSPTPSPVKTLPGIKPSPPVSPTFSFCDGDTCP